MKPFESRTGLFLVFHMAGMISMLVCAWFPGSAAGETIYSIQIAATQEKASAEETVEEMTRMGYNAFSRLEDVKGRGRWYRVYVEKFSSRAEAEKEARTLKSLGLILDYAVRALSDGSEAPPAGKAGPPPPPDKPESVPQKGKSDSRPAAISGARTPSRLYYLHTGSFKEKENAEKTVRELVKHDQKAFFVEEELSGEKWFRVYIGEFKSEKEARRSGAQLKEKGLITYFKPIGFDKGPPPTTAPKKKAP
jgi:cell division septation protein DedD